MRSGGIIPPERMCEPSSTATERHSTRPGMELTNGGLSVLTSVLRVRTGGSEQRDHVPPTPGVENGREEGSVSVQVRGVNLGAPGNQSAGDFDVMLLGPQNAGR